MRNIAEVKGCMAGWQEGNILFVRHRGLGTLSHCALSSFRIDRRLTKGPEVAVAGLSSIHQAEGRYENGSQWKQ